MLLGLFLGPVITLVFSLLPLWQLRKLSPMQAFREQDMEYSRSAKWLFYGIIASLILLYSALISNDLKTGLFFAVALLLAFLFLMLTAKLFMLLLKALPLNHLPFASRYAMKSLYRPKNQSFVLIVALGMASFMLLLIFFLKSSLLAQVTVSQKERQANMVFFDIQSDQVAALRQSLLEDQVEVIQEIPMISMRIASINGKGVKELRQNLREFEKAKNEKGRRSASWTLTREYRSTYRSELLPTEEILEGEFTSSYSGDGPIPISVEEGLMGRLGLKMNDLVVFDIQGIELECQIRSKRKVDWMQMSPNFFVLFPANILEEAPQMNVFMLRGEGDLNAIQQKTVRQFSNVSTIDVSMILRSVGRILDSISFALQFIAFFSVVAAFVVQISSIQLSLQERIREAVLLKMIGSSKAMMIRVLNMEFLILSFLAFVLGATLALIATWGICQFVFKIAVQIHWPALFICAGILLSFTFILATLNSQLVYRRTSMEGQRG